MIRGLIFLCCLALIGGAAYWFLAPNNSMAKLCPLGEEGTAPSGRVLSLCDFVYEVQPNNDTWAVVRVVDPGLATNQGRDDHDWACDLWGMPAAESGPNPPRIVVQIMAEPFVRGEPSPGITQSIEVYSVQGGTCQWELL